jgi:hypothetical protein
MAPDVWVEHITVNRCRSAKGWIFFLIEFLDHAQIIKSLRYGRYGSTEEGNPQRKNNSELYLIYVDDELVFAMPNLPQTGSGEL